MSDEELRKAFGALRQRDRQRAPHFGTMRAQAERRAQARRRRNGALVALAIAAVVLLGIVWIGRPGEPRVVLAPSPEPLAFLLTPPSASVVSADAPIDQIGEAW
jgi:hypothetical protein